MVNRAEVDGNIALHNVAGDPIVLGIDMRPYLRTIIDNLCRGIGASSNVTLIVDKKDIIYALKEELCHVTSTLAITAKEKGNIARLDIVRLNEVNTLLNELSMSNKEWFILNV